MSDFYIVPPRLITGSLDRSNVVTSVNTLRGNLSFRVNPDTGLVLNINSGTFNFSIAPDFYIKKSGDIVNSNIIFQPNYGNYGLAVGSGSSDPITGVPGSLFFRTDIDVLKVYDGSTWNEIASTGTSGITATFADGRYLRLDGGNVPTAAISMGSQFLRFANLTTRSIAGTAGQVYFNTDTNKLDLYNGSNWTAVGSGITSLTPGTGITLSSNPITSFGSIGVDQSYNFNWTGSNTFSNPITFAPNQQFDASKLTIAYEVAGDLLTFNGANWSRLAKGTANQILAVDCCGGGVNYRTLEAGAGIAISPTPNSIVISATGASGFSPGGGSAIGLSSLNGLGTTDQFLVIGYSGYGPNIVSSGSTHTFNIPFAGIGTSGLVTGLAQTFGGVKTFEEILLGLPLNSKYGGTGYTNYNLGDLLVGAGSSFVVLSKAPSSRYVLSTNSNTASGLAWTTNAGVFITSLAPTVVQAYTGDLWYNSSNGSFNILYTDEDTTQWVEIVGGNVQEILSGVSYGIPYYVPGTTTITSDNNFLNNGSSIFIGYGTGSTTPTTGALTVIGGVGISGDTNVGGVVTVSETVNVSSGGFSDLIGGFAPLSTGFRQLNVGDPVGTLVNYGGFANVGNAFIGGTTTITDTSASLSTRSGALVVFGGVGIGGSIFQSSTKASSISGVVLDNGSVRYASWAGNAITAFYGGTGYTNYTKGDILVGAGSTFIILQPGSNDQVLTVDNTATSGYKWSTVTATGGGSAIGISTINGIGVTDQFIAFGYSGTEPNIVSSGSTHTINIPLAGNGITGLVSSTGTQYFSGVKIFTNNVGVNGTVVATTLDADTLIVDQASIGSSFQVLGDLVVGTATTGSLYFQRAYMGSIDSVEWPYISFIGTTNRPMTLNVLNDGTLAFNGTYGQLFSIQENSVDSGWIHKISDISGMPILRVHSDGVVALGEYGGSVGIGKSDPSYKLDVVGDINLSAGSNYYIDGVPISAGAGGSGISQINGLTSTSQFLTTGTSGLDFNISSTGRTHIFNLPDASATARGLVNTSSQTFAGQKTFTSAIVGNLTVSSSAASTSVNSGALIVSGGVGIGGSLYTEASTADSISGVVLSNGVITSGSWAGNSITAFYGGTGQTTYAKGDILVGIGDSLQKFAVGTDSYVLTADSTSSIGVTWKAASASGTTVIGIPTDGVYSDGFFTDWTNSTSISNAFDDVNELLALIAPAKPGSITSTSLTATTVPTYYTVGVSAGLGTEWYQAGYGTGSSITRYYLSGAHTLTTANTSTAFYAGTLVTSTYGRLGFGRYNYLTPSGAGYGTIDMTVNYTIGATNNNLRLSDLAVYNNIWTKANAQISAYTQSNAGYEGVYITHTTNSQVTNTYEMWKDPWSASNGSPTYSKAATATTTSQTLRYLSGISYYTIGTGFSVDFKGAAGIYSSCYNVTQVYRVTATGLNTINGTVSSPVYSSELDKSGANAVAATLNSASASSFTKSISTTIYKAHGTTATSAASIAKYINTYSIVSTDTYEGFQDEARRLVIGSGIAFTSNIDMASGNLQVRSGTLIYPQTAEYDSEWGGTHTFSNDQEYQRYFYKTSASTGALTFTGFTASNISPYGTGSVNVLLYLEGDAKYFDLGVLQGSNSNNGSTRALAISAKTSASSGALNWSLGVFTTGVSGAGNSGRYRAIIIFRNNTYTMTSITSS